MEENIDEKLMAEKITDLDQGISIWKIGIDRLREQDKNARIMDNNQFKLLQRTIGRDKRLEQLPFVTPKNDGRGEFNLISGHHRTRAARMAGLQYVFCIVDENEMTDSRLKSKQLAHNSIQGRDDEQILLEILRSIDDVEDKIYSGVSEDDIMKKMSTVKIDEMEVQYETEVISLVFTEKGFKDFDDTMTRVADSEKIYMAEKSAFDEYVDVIRKTSRREDIRNVTGIVLKMSEIVNKYYDELDKENKNG